MWTSEEKMMIVLEGLRGDESISKICAKHGISQSQYYKWRDTFLELAGPQIYNKSIKAIVEDD